MGGGWRYGFVLRFVDARLGFVFRLGDLPVEESRVEGAVEELESTREARQLATEDGVPGAQQQRCKKQRDADGVDDDHGPRETARGGIIGRQIYEAAVGALRPTDDGVVAAEVAEPQVVEALARECADCARRCACHGDGQRPRDWPPAVRTIQPLLRSAHSRRVESGDRYKRARRRAGGRKR